MKNKNIITDSFFRELAKKAQAGDEASYRELLLKIADRLRPFLYSHIFNKDMVEDLLQEILIGINEALHTYNPKQSFLSWSSAICSYKLVEYISKYQKIPDNEMLKKECFNFFADDYKIYYDEQLEESLQSAIDNLPEKQRQVMLMFKVNDYSVKQVAQELKLTVNNLKNIAYKAYNALRIELKDN